MTGTTKPSRDSAPFLGQVNRMFDRVAVDGTTLLNSVMKRRPAPSLARTGGGPGRAWRPAARPSTSVAAPVTLTLELARRVAPGGLCHRLRLL